MLDVIFIKPIDYPEWVSKIVLVGKTIGGIKICTDFSDLNKACSKDDFPLPNIDMIVDLAIGHEMLSLRIIEEDQHNMTFTAPWGIFCYQVMPFGLKNVGATYQRAMATIFHDLLHNIM